MDNFTTVVALIGIVIIVASLVSGALEKSGLPLVAVFLALGALLGPWGFGLVDVGFHSPALHVLAMLGLALVLFSDAVTIELTELRARKRMLWRLLGPGTLVPALIIAAAAHWMLGFTWPAAAIVGAALASTDPVLLRSVLRSRAMPTASRVALRIETGMNDVVLLPIVVLAMLALRAGGAGTPVAPDEVGRSVLGLFVLGPLLGAAVGWIGITALARVRSTLGVRRDYESLYAIGIAFSGFAVAEAVGGSGFVAAFAAGLVVASQDIELCDCFLEYGEATAEMLLLLTFVALGTSLIWLGLGELDLRTLAFAGVALAARTVVLYPVLARTGVPEHDRRLIALFGPRGLSSLLLTLLPVFAGIRGAERLFAVTCLVVLLSVVLHGGGIAVFLRRVSRRDRAAAQRAAEARAVPDESPAVAVARADVRDAGAGDAGTGDADAPDADPEFITLDGVRRLQTAGTPLVIIDARTDRNFAIGELQAAHAVRVLPDDPVRDATARRLSQRATLVVYCA